MAEKSYLPYVGHVLFPRRPEDLSSTTQCPACFNPLASTLCSVCGLDLSNPLAAELRAASLEGAAALDRRLEIIGRIRFESAQAASAAAAPVAAAAVPASTIPAPPPAPAVAVAATVAPAAAPTTPTPDATPRRHFGVQVILLIVGVALLAIGAIFFLVSAFITFGLVWRSVIILAVTIAAFVGASLLRRRNLVATAEAIAALAVVFVYLDAFALRANDLFGTGSTDALTYWGVVLVLSAVGFLVWHRLSALRLPSIVGFTAAAPGAALLVAGLTEPLEDSTRVFAAFTALALAALIHPLAGIKLPERIITLSLGAFGVVAVAISALFLERGSDWAPTIGLAVIAAIALVHALLLVRTGTLRVFAFVFAALGGIIAASALVPVGFRANAFEFMVIAPVVSATVIALVLDLISRRSNSVLGTQTARVAAWSAAAIGGLELLIPLATAIGPVASVTSLAEPRWGVPGSQLITLRPEHGTAILALVAITALLAGFWAASRVLAARYPVILWASVFTLILAVPLVSVLWLIVGLWLAIGAVGVVALIVLRERGIRMRLPIAVGAGTATALAYATSWASIDTWWIGSLAAIAILLAARGATSYVIARAVLLGVAVVLAFVAIGFEFVHLNEVVYDGRFAGYDAAHAVGALAVLLLIASALVRGRIVSPIDTQVVFWMSFVTAAVTAAISWVRGAVTGELGSLVLPEFGTSAVLAGASLLALLLWILVPQTAAFRTERIAASVAIAPTVAWLVDSLTRVFALPEFVNSIGPISAALLVATASLAIAVLRPASSQRTAREVGIGLVGVPAMVASAVTVSPDAWLVLLLGGITTLLVAISRDGLVGSVSARKHLGWLALALATAGFWWRLGDSRVRDLEPYVLPLAGALLLIALMAWRAARPEPSRAAPYIALGGLLTAILPIAGYSTTGDSTRTIVVVAASALLLIAGSFVRGTVALRPSLDVAAIAGAAGVIVGGFGRAIAESLNRNTTDLTVDVWLGVSFAVLLLAAVGQAGITSDADPAPRRVLSQSAGVLAMVAVLVIELSLIGPDTFGTARAMTLVLLFGAIHIASFIIDRAPFSRLVSWIAIALAVIAGIGGIVREAIDPLEWASVPIAVALLVTGAVQLRRSPTARSWAWVAPGLLVLLLPSLIATFVEQPVWRLVALGVACIAAIVVGALRRLQAPLIIGAIIVLIHGLRTFAPAIRTVYELTEWWVWAVVGGAIVLFLGLTFEKRVRDLKNVTERVSSLR
ncbi:hypothetical protein BH10ACT7_BH10ACT7_19590 [soil metagenome]